MKANQNNPDVGNQFDSSPRDKTDRQPVPKGRGRPLFRSLVALLVLLLVVLGGGYTLFTMSPSWFRIPGWVPFPAGGDTPMETVQAEIPPIDSLATAPLTDGDGKEQVFPIEPTQVGPAIPEIKEQIDLHDQRIAFQGSVIGKLESGLEALRESQAGIERKLDEITTRLTLREGVDMNTINGMVERQAFLENRMNETSLHLDTRIEAVVGSLSLVKKQMANQEELIAGLSGDIYLLTRYGFGEGNRLQNQVPATSGKGLEAEANIVPEEPEFKRGDYRVGDWIQGYGEVLSIHRTIEGDYLVTENGRIFAKAGPEGEDKQ